MTRASLSPRQMRSALDILTALMVMSVAVALAGLTWRIAGHAGTGAITVPGGRSTPGAPIDPAPIVALAPFGAAVATDAGQPTGIAAVLKGVVAAQSPDNAVAFIELSGQPARAFRIGDGLEGGTITAILRDRVLIDNAGRAEFLAFPDPAGAAAPTAAPSSGSTPPAVPGGAPAAPGAGTAAPSISQVMQRLDASPVANGYAIGGNAPPGLRPGDVIQAINGASLSDPAGAQAAIAAAAGSGQAQVNILRDGKLISITVPLK